VKLLQSHTLCQVTDHRLLVSLGTHLVAWQQLQIMMQLLSRIIRLRIGCITHITRQRTLEVAILSFTLLHCTLD
jgi:hypothetical protein